MAAGEPILAAEHVEDHYPVDPALFHPRAHYLLRVRGMSMRDIGIMDGDLQDPPELFARFYAPRSAGGEQLRLLYFQHNQ